MYFQETNTHYLIKLPPAAADFKKKLASIKRLPGRQWWDNAKSWAIPIANFKTLNQLIEKINRDLQPVQQDMNLPANVPPIDPLPELSVEIKLKKTPYPFQLQGVAYNIEKGNVLNGDQQGLGKTVEAIATVMAMDMFPCLIIAKKTLLHNWKTEWEAWTDKKPVVFDTRQKNTWQFYYSTGLAQVGIVNYESLQQFFVYKIDVPPGESFRVKHIQFKPEITMFKSIIIDESHYVKDGKTKRTKFCIGLTRHLQERGVMLLSGTAAINDPMDLYTQLTILNRAHKFGSYDSFRRTYAGKNNKENLKWLNFLLHKHCYFRRTKAEVRADMPPKTRQVILCDISTREEYDKAAQHFTKYLKEKLELSQGEIDQKLRAEAMVQMGILKKIAARGKMEAIEEWVHDLLEAGEKIVLFAYHKDIQHHLVQAFDGAVAIAAQDTTSMAQIEENKRLFMTTKTTNVIVCSIAAASEGHTLNAASQLGMCELPWHFGKAEQCEDRIHRITNWLPANIAYFLAEGTIDRDIYKLIMEKKDMHDSVTGTMDDVEETVIDKLINLFNQR